MLENYEQEEASNTQGSFSKTFLSTTPRRVMTGVLGVATLAGTIFGVKTCNQPKAKPAPVAAAVAPQAKFQSMKAKLQKEGANIVCQDVTKGPKGVWDYFVATGQEKDGSPYVFEFRQPEWNNSSKIQPLSERTQIKDADALTVVGEQACLREKATFAAPKPVKRAEEKKHAELRQAVSRKAAKAPKKATGHQQKVVHHPANAR